MHGPINIRFSYLCITAVFKTNTLRNILQLRSVDLPAAETSCAILSHALSWMFLLPYSALLESKRHLCFSINDTNKILKSGSSLMVAWHVIWWWQNYGKLPCVPDAVQVTSNTHVTLRRSLSARFASDRRDSIWRGPARRGSLYVTAVEDMYHVYANRETSTLGLWPSGREALREDRWDILFEPNICSVTV